MLYGEGNKNFLAIGGLADLPKDFIYPIEVDVRDIIKQIPKKVGHLIVNRRVLNTSRTFDKTSFQEWVDNLILESHKELEQMVAPKEKGRVEGVLETLVMIKEQVESEVFDIER